MKVLKREGGWQWTIKWYLYRFLWNQIKGCMRYYLGLEFLIQQAYQQGGTYWRRCAED